MIKYYDDIEQGTPEWLAAREGKYTGSNAYKLLTSFGAGQHAQSSVTGFTGNFYTKRGHLLEEEAIELYESITGSSVSHCGFITNTTFTNCLYSPDGFTETKIIEVKCFGEKPHMAIYQNDIPMKILAQIHFGMMVCEKRAAQLLIYNPKLAPALAYKCIDIEYDPAIEKRFKTILGVT